jgi:NADPH2:quinone reductase
VRIHASGVNPTDIYARSGARAIPMSYDRVIPHQDGAGVVDAIGQGVSGEWLGQRVWVHMAQWRRPQGTAAEWVVLPLRRVAALPAGYAFELGACLGVPWLTANLAVSEIGAIAGRDVLITGGAGAVAIYAIQVAARLGARVITTAGSARAAALARQAGADDVADHRHGDLAERLKAATGGRGFDRVIESRVSANAALYPAMLRERARVVVYGTSGRSVDIDVSAAIRTQTQFRFIYAYAMTPVARDRAVDRLAAWEADRKLTHLPLTTFPLDEIASAHIEVERGNHGRRSVVQIG